MSRIFFFLVLLWLSSCNQRKVFTIYYSDSSSFIQRASREIRRYAYLRTGELPDIKPLTSSPAAGVILSSEIHMPAFFNLDADDNDSIKNLKEEDYALLSVNNNTLLITGGSDKAILYGAYRFIESMGVRFYLHGDVIPDEKIGKINLFGFNERHHPLFSIRGINPFHDFPEGPDWWEENNYKAILEQMAKLRMNFIGLHNYTSQSEYTHMEPGVWMGLPGDFNPDGSVKRSYPAKYANTGLFAWGYHPVKTSAFLFGADLIFDKDDYSSALMDGLAPIPEEPAKMNELFDRAGKMYRDCFEYAHELGIKTCIGTELPLELHSSMRDDYLKKQLHLNPEDSAVIGSLYKGTFQRIMATYPLDYYWLWTNEGWTWSIPSKEEVKKVIRQISIANAARIQAEAPFRLALCGWVLGPPDNRSMFDQYFPDDIPMACINRNLGYDPVEPYFSQIRGREKWAIPWMEDDPSLITPQLWAGRVRRDAADALAYGCTGLIGIHWRTDLLAPNFKALAEAAWSQESWNPGWNHPWSGKPRLIPEIENTDADSLYGTVAYNADYQFPNPGNVPVKVTLYFCETEYARPGKRVFDIMINGHPVKENLDIFKEVGKNRPLDLSFEQVNSMPGPNAEKVIRISFLKKVGFPCISGLTIEGNGMNIRINSGGEAYQSFARDLSFPYYERHPNYGHRHKAEVPYFSEFADYSPVNDLYNDFCLHEFGSEIGKKAAGIFERIDGNLPKTADWISGPGDVYVNYEKWDSIAPRFSFVNEFEKLGEKVTGDGNMERYKFWLTKFKYLRTIAELGCRLGEFHGILKKFVISKDRNYAKEYLAMRDTLANLEGKAIRYLLSSFRTTGEMGTIANLEQRQLLGWQYVQGDSLWKVNLTRYDGLYEKLTGTKPDTVNLYNKEYQGNLRIVVPAIRTSIRPDEDFILKVIILGNHDPSRSFLNWKILGSPGNYNIIPLVIRARSVYEARIPASEISGNDIEYYVASAGPEGTAVFPASGGKINLTLINLK